MSPPLKMLKICNAFKGFTLAKVLIALAILGVIAMFNIPKIKMTEVSKYSKTKEVASMISNAYLEALLAGVITDSTKPFDLTPYMNYVSVNTSGTVIDSTPLDASSTCEANTPCVWLHNAGILWFASGTFTASSNLRAIEFRFDPDLVYNTTPIADGPLKAVRFMLYRDGFLTTGDRPRSGSILPPAGN